MREGKVVREKYSEREGGRGRKLKRNKEKMRKTDTIKREETEREQTE